MQQVTTAPMNPQMPQGCTGNEQTLRHRNLLRFRPSGSQRKPMKSLISTLFVLLLCGSAVAETVTLTAHDFPAGDGPADLASNGIPFEPGALFDASNLKLLDDITEVAIATQVLARWHGDNSIRSVLLQFDAPFVGASKTYSLQIGEARTLNATLTAVTWDLPTRVITLDPDYLCGSQIVGPQKPLGSTTFTDWETKQIANYDKIDFGGATPTDCPNADQYYDAIHTTYQLYARSGDKDHLINGRRWALHHARDQIYVSGDSTGHAKCFFWEATRYTYVQGLVDDYFFWGGSETKSVAGIVVNNFYMTHYDEFYYLPPGGRYTEWTERDAAFALMGLIAYYEATNNPTYLDKATARINSLHQMQAELGGTAWVHNLYDHDPSECADSTDWGISPWMTGLMLEPIIEYHRMTGSTIARQSILWALEYLKNNALAPSGAYTGVSFIYMPGCSDPVYAAGNPDLDNMISHAFAYGYTITGNADYRDIALDVFNTCVDHGWTGDAKHYNQQFRSSGRTVAYLTDVPSASPQTTPARTLQLHSSYPNPFNPQTTIAYTLPAAGRVSIAIYDVTGRLTARPVDDYATAGPHRVHWTPASTLPSGVYFVRIQFGAQHRATKVVLLK